MLIENGRSPCSRELTEEQGDGQVHTNRMQSNEHFNENVLLPPPRLASGGSLLPSCNTGLSPEFAGHLDPWWALPHRKVNHLQESHFFLLKNGNYPYPPHPKSLRGVKCQEILINKYYANDLSELIQSPAKCNLTPLERKIPVSI